MTVGERVDPYLGYRFRVELENLVVAGFSEVSGLEVEVATEEYQEGGVNGFVHHLPREVRHPPLLLRRGLTEAGALWDWQRSVSPSRTRIDRKTIRIFVLDSEGREAVSWRCLQAYPVRWSGPVFRGDCDLVAFECVELVHCGIQKS
jgi:phage tail-like protein